VTVLLSRCSATYRYSPSTILCTAPPANSSSSAMDSPFPDSPIEDEEADNFFPNYLMADSQISSLDIASLEPAQPNERTHVPARSTPVTRTNRTSNSYSSSPFTRGDAYSETPRYRPWEEDAVTVESRHLPARPDESQQDLAERLNHITHTLDSYVVRPCRRVPGILKTYYPGVRDGLQDGLEALVAREGQLRRAVANHVNGREMARLQEAGGGGGVGGEEVSRLKNRLVEQDALLWDSNQHVKRLMRERDALKRQLETTATVTPTTTATRRHDPVTEGDLLGLDINEKGSSQPGETPPDARDADDDNQSTTSEKEVTVPVDQLRELRVLIDQISIREVSLFTFLSLSLKLKSTQASKHERWKSVTNEDRHGGASDGDDEEPGWTML
jgi:hypothetical protein